MVEEQTWWDFLAATAGYAVANGAKAKPSSELTEADIAELEEMGL